MKRQYLQFHRVTFSLLLLLLILLTACGQQQSASSCNGVPPGLEASLLAGHWQGIDAGVAPWLHCPTFQRQASILRGYAAFARGDVAAASGHFLRARSAGHHRQETAWEDALAMRHPKRAAAHFLLGDALARQGDWPGALTRLNTALDLAPEFTTARLARGVLLVLGGDRTHALEDLDLLAQSGPVVAEALTMRAMVRLEHGQLEHAADDLQRALEHAPTHAIAYNARGLLHAPRGAWDAAADDFAAAFRLLPELREARRNWQLAQFAQAHGTVISARETVGSITIVVADPGQMRTITASAREMVQGQTKKPPAIVQNVNEAIAKASSQDVILEVPSSGLDMAYGDRLLKNLKEIGTSSIGAKVTVNIVTHGFEAADSATKGIIRYEKTTTASQQAKINSLQLVDPSELSGLVGKTPLGGTNLGLLAKRSGDIGAKGVTVVVYTVEGKFGTQHIKNVEDFRDTPGIVVYMTASKSQVETGLSIPGGVSIGLSNANDQASNRTNLQARDWTVSQHGTQQTVTSTLSDLGKHYIDHSQKRPTKTPIISPPSHGGILLGPVHLARGASGRIVFQSGAAEDAELAVVYTLFGAQDFHGGAAGSTLR